MDYKEDELQQRVHRIGTSHCSGNLPSRLPISSPRGKEQLYFSLSGDVG